MRYNFDQIIDRRGTGSVKYDLRKKFFGNEDILPLWVADMDFASPDFITNAISERARHPVYGYTVIQDGFFQSIVRWMKRRHDWMIDRDWILFFPGVVPALHHAVLAYTDPGDKIIIQPPVYFSFFPSLGLNDRHILHNQLLETGSTFKMDLDRLEKMIDEKTRLLFLCHPHNPTGTVWDKEVLGKLTEICSAKSVIIISDEIHSDLILGGQRHVPLASLSKESAKITVTCVSPSKSFNLAGLASAAVIIPDPALRRSMKIVQEKIHTNAGNIFGLTAMQAAYEHGDEWLDSLLDYLQGNLRFLLTFFDRRIPDIKVYKPESTFMVWLDFRRLNLTGRELSDLIIHKAGLGLIDGKNFGPGGEGFQRLNFALPRPVLQKALEQLEKAIYSGRKQNI
jgi:cystathionine beta-lyase